MKGIRNDISNVYPNIWAMDVSNNKVLLAKSMTV